MDGGVLFFLLLLDVMKFYFLMIEPLSFERQIFPLFCH